MAFLLFLLLLIYLLSSPSPLGRISNSQTSPPGPHGWMVLLLFLHGQDDDDPFPGPHGSIGPLPV